MFDYKEDDHKNIYLIGQEELISGQDIIFEIEITKLKQNQEVDFDSENNKYDNIEIEYLNLEDIDTKGDIDYRRLENKKYKNIILYKDIDIEKKYVYPVVYIINDKDNIVKNNHLLIPDKETYGIIG
jgi:hypothetical protein